MLYIVKLGSLIFIHLYYKKDNNTNIGLKYLLLKVINKKLDKKKFYQIILIIFRFKIFVIFDIKIIAKYSDMTY